ncbi:inosine xanthosine triphosphatase [Blastocystis sp. subtype 4]|uniref:inosine xanthosine triphosphatase n=1 Tax=Blastocystis sp. subtype 4 TaxID=944170 RepID=UPI000711DD33|nr:inosine xanthosine triphosphatase [Blastocystis sp. subtype 4]KNB44430.1 inosine xanthosine triphosphatase [Blastocystis sp. subtype 4]|eukprot:XP_014527888.1 inosine xanthosine triphosphatase [Blastocystis sp. subtype 4]
MVTVLVASTNPCKIEACQLAFCRVFKDDTIDFRSISSDSGVSSQPIGDDETRQGAINRVHNVLSKWRCDNSADPDFVVGLEGGVMKCDDPISGKRSLRLIAWMAIHRPHDNRWGVLVICMLLLGFGQTGSMFLPPAVVDLVDSGMELGIADDQFFGRVNSGRENGTVGILTNNIITRSSYYEHALILALIPFIHPEIYN